MKKLFISCPMKGRTKEAIMDSRERMHRAAEAIFGEPLEVIESYIDVVPSTKNERVWCLGEAIKKMAEADYFIGVNIYGGCFQGCDVENRIAMLYGITSTIVDYIVMMPDVVEIENKLIHKTPVEQF